MSHVIVEEIYKIRKMMGLIYGHQIKGGMSKSISELIQIQMLATS